MGRKNHGNRALLDPTRRIHTRLQDHVSFYPGLPQQVRVRRQWSRQDFRGELRSAGAAASTIPCPAHALDDEIRELLS